MASVRSYSAIFLGFLLLAALPATSDAAHAHRLPEVTAELWEFGEFEGALDTWEVLDDPCDGGRFDNNTFGPLEYWVYAGISGCARARLDVTYPSWADRIRLDLHVSATSVLGTCSESGVLRMELVNPGGSSEELARFSYEYSELNGADNVLAVWQIDLEDPVRPRGQDVGLIVTASHIACQDAVANGTSLLPPQFARGGEEGPILEMSLVQHSWHAPIALTDAGNSHVQTNNRAVLRERRFAFEIPPIESAGRGAGYVATQVLLHMPEDHQFNALTAANGDLIPAQAVSTPVPFFNGSHASFYHRDMLDGGKYEVLLIHVQSAAIGPMVTLGILFVAAGLIGPPVYGHQIRKDYRKRLANGFVTAVERRSALRAAAAAALVFAVIVIWLIVQRPLALLYPWPISPAVATFFVLTLGVLLLLAFIHQTVARGHARHLDVSLGESLSRSSELESIAYGATHDLKAPLTGLNWLIADLEDQMAKRAPRTAEALSADINRIRGSVADMGGLLEDLLALIRLESDAFPVDAVSLSETAAAVSTRLHGAAASHRGSVTITGKLPAVRGNVTLLRQLLHNLVDNGLKYGDQEVGPRVEIGAVQHESAVRLFVDDNGPGIPEEHREAVFRLLSKNPDERRHIEGTGIGLALVRRIARKHSGDVTIEDSPLGGARFTVTLPAAT